MRRELKSEWCLDGVVAVLGGSAIRSVVRWSGHAEHGPQPGVVDGPVKVATGLGGRLLDHIEDVHRARLVHPLLSSQEPLTPPAPSLG